MPIVSMLAGWSVPELVGISLVIVALVYLILYWAGSTLFGGLLRAMASNIPFVGGYISDAIGGVLEAVNSWAAGWVNGAISGMVRLVLVIPQTVIAIASTIVGSFEWLIGQVLSLGFTIAQLVCSVTLQFATLTLKILAHANLIAWLQTAIADAQHSITWIYETFIPAQIRDAIATVERDFTNALGAAIQGIETDIQDVRDGIATDIQDVRDGIATDIQDVRDGIATDIQDVAAGIETDIVDVAEGIEKTIEQVLGIDAIFALIDLCTSINRKPEETAHALAEAASDLYGIGQTVTDIVFGKTEYAGMGSIAWPVLTKPERPSSSGSGPGGESK